MASRNPRNGVCSFCDGIFGKTGMARHIASCGKRKKNLAGSGDSKGSRKAAIMHLSVAGEECPDYWMHVEIPAAGKLHDLDQFLRHTWLECCGHLSAFTIEGQRYSCSPMKEYDEKSMNAPLYSVLVPGKTFDHEYDFGSTTTLTLKLLDQRKGDIGRPRISILARNLPPVIACTECENEATQVCVECIYSGKGWHCDCCAEEHECGEDMFLPVVNSPRVGVCGYTG